MILTKSYRLRAIHSLHQPQFSDDQNNYHFRHCGKVHGHEYKIEVSLRGELDSRAQWVFDRDQLDQLVETHVIQPFDKTNLNVFFANTSGEALAHEFYKILKNTPIGPKLYSLAIQETRKNRFLATFEDQQVQQQSNHNPYP